MAKAELGTKRHCGGCGAKFYDLAKSPIICPKCGTVFEVVVATSNSRREAAKAVPVEPEKVVEEVVEPDIEIVSLDDVAADEAVDVDVDDEDIVVEDDTEIEDDDDDTFLEEDEDDEDDVSGLLGGGLAGEDEEV